MSADNFVGLLKTPNGKGGFEYRVAHGQAIDNLTWKHEDGNPQEVIAYFGKCEVFTSEINALQLAIEIEKEVGFVEYGIVLIELPHPFSYYKEKGT